MFMIVSIGVEFVHLRFVSSGPQGPLSVDPGICLRAELSFTELPVSELPVQGIPVQNWVTAEFVSQTADNVCPKKVDKAFAYFLDSRKWLYMRPPHD